MSANRQFLSQLPVPLADPVSSSDTASRDQVVQLVEQMLTLHQFQSATKTPQEQTALERQIAATDSQLDTLIYALYGLTDAEIKIVEKGRPGLPDRGRRTSVSEFVAVEADLIEGQGLEPEFPCG